MRRRHRETDEQRAAAPQPLAPLDPVGLVEVVRAVGVAQEKRRAINDLLSLINERMWFGHFELCSEAGTPMFRHTMLTRGWHGVNAEQLEDLVDIAVAECERFYPAFQFVLWGGKSPADALEAAMVDPAGEA